MVKGGATFIRSIRSIRPFPWRTFNSTVASCLKMMAIEIFQASDARRLTSIFLAWKAALVVLTALCPGPGYDTSALILLSDQENRQKHFQIFSIVDSFALKLLRWDAFYFTKAAQRGYLYEQEWAFSRAYSTMLGISTRCRYIIYPTLKLAKAKSPRRRYRGESDVAEILRSGWICYFQPLPSALCPCPLPSCAIDRGS